MEIIRRETDYAIRALLYLADEGEKRSSAEIAKACEIPKSFTYKILNKLAGKQIIYTQAGRTGGSQIVRSPRDITLLEVVEALQGPVCVSKCVLDSDACARSGNCPVHDEWGKLQKHMLGFFTKTTFADILEASKETK